MLHVDYNCIFCAIVAKRAPASIEYESDGALAFLDIHPIVGGHTLVIPKKHYRNLFDLDDESGRAVIHASRIVARALRAALAADGLTVVQSNESAGGQSVFHYHVHLLPRYFGDGLISRPENLRGRASLRVQGTPDQIAAQIRTQIRDE